MWDLGVEDLGFRASLSPPKTKFGISGVWMVVGNNPKPRSNQTPVQDATWLEFGA